MKRSCGTVPSGGEINISSPKSSETTQIASSPTESQEAKAKTVYSDAFNLTDNREDDFGDPNTTEQTAITSSKELTQEIPSTSRASMASPDLVATRVSSFVSLEGEINISLPVPSSLKVAKQIKKGRPNMQDLSLIARTLKAANLVTAEDLNAETATGSLFSEFRDIFLNGPKEEGPSFEQELKKVQAHLISRCLLLGTTASNADEKLLADNPNPEILIIDEAGMTAEAELLIAVTRFSGSVEQVILVDDVKQLPSVKTSKGQKRTWVVEGNPQTFEAPVCIFEKQVCLPFMGRLQDGKYLP